MTETVQVLDLRWIRGKTGDWGNTIREIELLAAEIMVKEGNELDPSDTGCSIEWAAKYIRKAGQEPHQGDCHLCRSWLTAPITCDACVYDEYMLKAWAKKREAIEAANSMLHVSSG